MRVSNNNPPQRQLIQRLLARVPAIRNACDLDLMLFLNRHPRALLTTEQLAGFVGYNLKEIAQALDAFIEAGLLARTAQQSMHAARYFVLLLESPQSGGVKQLMELGATRQGRESILQALNGQGPRPNQSGAGPELRLLKRG